METLLSGLIEHMGGLIGLLLLTALIAIIKKIKSDMTKEVIDAIVKGFKPSYKSKMGESIKCDSKIYKELTRTLFNVKASRIGLFQFHNGNTFSTNNPIWKVSNTHEVCENGVATEISNVQDIKASLLNPLISALVNKSDSDGISHIEPCHCVDEHGTLDCLTSLGVYRIDTDRITNTFFHAFLLNRSSKFGLASAIVNIDNQVVGYVMLEFCADGEMTHETLTESSKMLCDTSSMTSQMLSTIESTK
jgi:hypothetical protein